MLRRTIEKFEKYDVISLYTDKKYSLSEIARIVKSDKRQVRDYLLAKKIKVEGLKNPDIDVSYVLNDSKSGRYFDSSMFDKIDCEEKAYWLGFLFADGYVIKNTVGLGLQACDVGHLHKFNRFMKCEFNNVSYHPKKTEGKIYDGYRWETHNKHITDRLKELGCVERKSLILEFPKEEIFADKGLIRHFIRGYFDGDGCVCATNKTHIVSMLGTESFLTTVKKYLNEENRKLYNNKERNIKTKSLQFYNQHALKILHYLYDDALIFLDRKHDKFLEFCRLYE